MIYRLLWVQFVIYLSVFAGIHGLHNKDLPLEKQHDTNDTKPKESTPKHSTTCGNAHSVCKAPTLKDQRQNNEDNSKLFAARECVPFVPSCPCAQGKSAGPVCIANMDLGFIVPVSPRKRRRPFVDAEVSRFIRQVVSRFQVSHKNTEVSVVSYGTTPKMAFSFNRFSCKGKVLHRLHNLAQVCPFGRPRIGKALSFADSHMFKKPSRKAKVIVLLTNQRSCDDVKTPAKRLRSHGVRILSLGIGRYIDGRQMDDISTKPVSDNIYTADIKYLDLVSEKLVRNVCLGAGGYLRDENSSSCLCAQKPTI